MKKFNSYFIEQLIICIIIFGIGFTILMRAVTAFVLNQIEPDINTVAYPVVLIGHLFNAICMVISVFVAQKNAQKKECTNTPANPMKYYLTVSAVLVIVNILYSVFGFSGTVGTCLKQISPIELMIGLQTSETLEIISKIRSSVLIAVMIGNILQAGILFGFTPVYVKNHEKLFKWE